jgi:hypothetical protein
MNVLMTVPLWYVYVHDWFIDLLIYDYMIVIYLLIYLLFAYECIDGHTVMVCLCIWLSD